MVTAKPYAVVYPQGKSKRHLIVKSAVMAGFFSIVAETQSEAMARVLVDALNDAHFSVAKKK